MLSIYALPDGRDYLSSEYMTDEQKARVLKYFQTVVPPFRKDCIARFRRAVPQAEIVEIPSGHHYPFIKQEELVYEAFFRSIRAFVGQAGQVRAV